MKKNGGTRIRVLSIFGSRPEAIKMVPVVAAMKDWPEHFESLICVSGHHDQLAEILDLFEIEPDFVLDAAHSDTDLAEIVRCVLSGVKTVLADAKPDVALVQGDFPTTFAAALACFYSRIPVGHIEAGIRSQDKFDSFPEEIHRRLADCTCDLYFAPTDRNRENLLREGCAEDTVFVTGNTVIDTLRAVLPRVRGGEAQLPDGLSPESLSPRTILWTCHRPESYGDQIEAIAAALADVVRERPDVGIVCPVHDVHRELLSSIAGNQERFRLIGRAGYLSFISLMDHAHIILTDSDGIQEEALSLDKPVLLLRDRTERPEAIESGGVRLVGTNPQDLVRSVESLLDDPQTYYDMAESQNPFGDGKSGIRIVNALYRRYARAA